MKRFLLENLIKNILLLVILGITYPFIRTHFQLMNLASDPALVANLLIAVSIIAVIACFGNFAFSYEKTWSNFADQFVAHVTTGLLMFVIGVSLEMTSLLLDYLVGPWMLMTVVLFALYIASVLYDFWDLRRMQMMKSDQ